MGNTQYKQITFDKIPNDQSGQIPKYNAYLIINEYRNPNFTDLVQTEKIKCNEITNESSKVIRKHIDQLDHNQSMDIPFCIIESVNTVDHCKKQISDDYDDILFKKFSFSISDRSCTSLSFRRGTIIDDENKPLFESLIGRDYYLQGKYCKITNVGFFYNDDKLRKCCVGNSIKNINPELYCNENLINKFETSHCNIIMDTHCKSFPESEECFLWLVKSTKRGDEIAFQTYEEICGNDMENPLCDFFLELTHAPDQPLNVYHDNALLKYCSNNKNNKKCECFLNTIDVSKYNSSEYYGAKECWQSSCVIVDDKWLSSNQRTIKQKCKIVSCKIKITQLGGEDGVINVTNDCVSTNKVDTSVLEKTNNDNPNTTITKKKFGGIFSSLHMLIFIILFLIINILFTYFYRLYAIKIEDLFFRSTKF